MTVVCLPNCAFLSETSRMVAVYRKLRELGADSVLATHGGPYEFVLRQEGVPYELIEPRLTADEARRQLEVLTYRPWQPLYEPAALQAHVRSEMAFFERHGARAVVIGFTLSAALSARGARIPLVVTHLGSFVPPALEAAGFASREAFDNPVTALLPGPWVDWVAGRVFTRARFQTRTFNAVARRLGIREMIRSTFDLLMGDLTLVTDVPEILGIPGDELEAWRPTDTHRFRPNARLAYAGAMFAELFGEFPDDAAEFLETDRPKVYVALASSRPEYVRRVREALEGLDVRAVIVTTVHRADPGAGANILVRDFLPSHLVMPRCDLAIIHGGQGSVQTAIAAGVPVIGFPLQPEQNFNLRLVERHGAGLCRSLRSLARGRLRDAIDTVLGDPAYKTAMAQLKGWQATRDGPLEVARKLMDLPIPSSR
jgi:UDP:flavonoid glycosyltransferase YjiC (YdhE family)